MTEGNDLQVKLRLIQPDEFEDYQKYFVADYAQEIMDNYGHSNIVALNMAKHAINTSFPDGITKDNDVLYCIDIVDTEELETNDLMQSEETEAKEGERAQLAGYLWRIIDDKKESCFISDFYVLPSMRSKGVGKRAINQLEQSLKEIGVSQIKLRVAHQNQRAVALYQAVGFNITGVNMSKLLS